MILMDNGQIELHPTLFDQTVPEGVLLGNGMNAITGEIFSSQTALQSLESTKPAEVKDRFTTSIITSEKDYEQEITAGASTNLNIGGFQLSASASYRSKVRYSATSMTILAHCYREDDGYVNLSSGALKEDAKALLEQNPNKFVDTYGQYYVSGIKRGSLLALVYVFQSTSSSSMQEIKASLSTSYDFFSASAFTDLQQKASQHDTWVSLDVFYSALKAAAGNPPDGTPKDYLDFFRAHYGMAARRAKLATYIGLDRMLDINPGVFTTLKNVYQSAAILESRFDNCPGEYADALQTEMNSVKSALSQTTGSLVEDPSALSALDAKIEALAAQIDQVYNRYDLFAESSGSRASEPGVGTWVQAPHSQFFNYGLVPPHLGELQPGVIVNGETLVHTTGHGIGHHTYNFPVGKNSFTLIVGFVVWQRRNDHGGEWKILDNPVILSDTATVQVRSEYDRAADYTVTGYWVDSADYQFPAVDKIAGQTRVYTPQVESAAA